MAFQPDVIKRFILLLGPGMVFHISQVRGVEGLVSVEVHEVILR